MIQENLIHQKNLFTCYFLFHSFDFGIKDKELVVWAKVV